MPKPNFFIVGAPKCGTTSLSAWLDSHPEACISKPKEPHFFSPNRKRTIKSLRDYESCFAHAQPQHKAIGEASTHTIYSLRAIGEILKYQPKAKFIVCLRNPVEMAVSLHNYMFFYSEQRIEDFVEAWNSDMELSPPYRDRNYKSGELYRHVCALGTLYKNLQEILPEGRLLTLLLDDVISNETHELKKVTEFLDISPFSATYPKINLARQVKSKQLRRVAEGLTHFKEKLGIRASFRVGGWILRSNLAEGRGVVALTPEIRSLLTEHFKPEIMMLAGLLDRDLSHWIEPIAQPSEL